MCYVNLLVFTTPYHMPHICEKYSIFLFHYLREHKTRPPHRNVFSVPSQSDITTLFPDIGNIFDCMTIIKNVEF